MKISFALLIILLVCQTASGQMHWNQACVFTGTSASYIAVGNTPSINLTGSFTLEAWVNPHLWNGFSKGVISKGGAFGISKIYAMRLQSTGRIDVWTNGVLRLTSNTSVPLNQWTHIAAVYNSSNSTFGIYFNGVPDGSVTVAGATPVSNFDSLCIGAASNNTPFSGMMDEVRVWNRALSSNEVSQRMRMSLGTIGGLYDNLVMSQTFQREISSGTRFSLTDRSFHFNNGKNNGVFGTDIGDVPTNMLSINQCVKFGSAGDYLAGVDNPAISPTTGATLQAWVYPNADFNGTIIHKGHPTGGASTNYSLSILNKKLTATINGTVYASQDTIRPGQWSHVALTYNTLGGLGAYIFYVNGKRTKAGLVAGVPITDGTDSLYIGGTPNLSSFFGYIDEVRVSTYAKTLADISDSLFIPMEGRPDYPGTTAAYNLDGLTWCNTYWGPLLFCRNTAEFAYASASFIFPESPLNKGTFMNFQNGFYTKIANKKIPAAGITGLMIDDTIDIVMDEIINDVNVYVALNHNSISEIGVYLITPDNVSIQLTNNHSLLSSSFHHMATVFDDQAVKSIASNTFATFSPSIKGFSSLSQANGSGSKGKWRLAIADETGPNTGMLIAWGLRINNKFVLPNLLSTDHFIQGFYNAATNQMTADTVDAYLRNLNSPYTIIDSSVAYTQSTGKTLFSFGSALITGGTSYLLQLNHRNSIETWSSGSIIFDVLNANAAYDFTANSNKAFGSNQIQVDTSPVEFAIYGGDPNRDGIVDLSDITMIFNDANIFQTGYVVTDVTGDNFVDLSDLTLTFNNSLNFVTKITP